MLGVGAGASVSKKLDDLFVLVFVFVLATA